MPLSHTDHLTLYEYCDYLEAYVHYFKLPTRSRKWRMNTKVVQIRRAKEGEEGNHILAWEDLKTGEKGTEWYDALALCTGLHVEASVPEIPGFPPLVQGDVYSDRLTKKSDTAKGNVDEVSNDSAPSQDNLSGPQSRILSLHSSQFKDPKIFKDQRVLIMGTGETGMDMGYLAVKNGAKEIVMCTRGGFLSFPAVLSDFVVMGVKFEGKLPIDGLISNLFEVSRSQLRRAPLHVSDVFATLLTFSQTAWVHPWVASSRLRWFVSDFGLKRVLWVLTGTQAGCSQWVGELPPERLGRAYVFLNKSAKAMPYLNRGYKKRHWLAESFARYLDPPDYSEDETHIDLAPFPHHLRADGVVEFTRNGRKEDLRMRGKNFKPDVAIYATGYRQSFPCLAEDYPLPNQADVRDLFSSSDPSVAFLGFVRPGVGGIPPIAELQSQLWTLILAKRIGIPATEPHYRLLQAPGARITYGVDHSAYSSQLARDMKADPALLPLAREHGLFVLAIYCLGAAFTPFYRLLGPWKSEIAPDVARYELWDTIERRGIGGNLMMGVIPMIFYGWVNAIAWLLEGLWVMITGRQRAGAASAGMGKLIEVRGARAGEKRGMRL